MKKTACMLIALSIVGCATLQQMLQKPTVTFKSVAVRDIALFEETLVFSFDIANPNPLGTVIQSVAYSLKSDNREILKGTTARSIAIAAGSTTSVDLPVTIKHLELFPAVEAFINADSVPYELTGSFGVGPFSLRYRHAGTLALPKIPGVSLKNVVLDDVNLSSATLLINVGLSNTNAFPVSIDGMDYKFKLGKTEFAQGSARDMQPLGKAESSVLSIPVIVDFLKLGRSAYNVLMKSSSDYELTGALKFNLPGTGAQKIPFSLSGAVPLDRN